MSKVVEGKKLNRVERESVRMVAEHDRGCYGGDESGMNEIEVLTRARGWKSPECPPMLGIGVARFLPKSGTRSKNRISLKLWQPELERRVYSRQPCVG